MVKWILTDIEGTTTSLTFVKDVLFPYSKKELSRFLNTHKHTSEVTEIIARVWEDNFDSKQKVEIEKVQRFLTSCIDEDRKYPPLKALQGLIWKEAYESGEVKGHLYSEVPAALERWKEKGIKLAVYSSGSEEAQRLLFKYSEYGDLSDLFERNFDTRVGPKQEQASYKQIVAELGIDDPKEILFLSDTEGELLAASTAGLEVCKLTRLAASQGSTFPSNFREVSEFEEIDEMLKLNY